MNKWAIGVVILVILLVGGYFGAKAVKHAMVPAPVAVEKTVSQPTPTAMPTEATPSATAQMVTVSAKEFAFTPSAITLKVGQPVTIVFKNMGTYPHNFTVQTLNVQTKTIQPGTQDTITFTPAQKGTFTYVCTVPGHADRGMKGTLTVE